MKRPWENVAHTRQWLLGVSFADFQFHLATEKQNNKQIKISGLKTLFFKVTLVVKGQIPGFRPGADIARRLHAGIGRKKWNPDSGICLIK